MIDSSALRFAAVGVAAVVIDFVGYRLLLPVVDSTALAKGISFLLGAGFAFVANGTYAFRSALTGTALIRFCAVYAVGLALNTLTNEVALAALTLEAEQSIGFLAATAVSATWNYVGLRRWTFLPTLMEEA